MMVKRLLKNRSNLPLYSGIVLVVICLVGLTSAVHATNESSYMVGFWKSSPAGGPTSSPGNSNTEYTEDTCNVHGPDTSFWSKGLAVPAVTNTTACENGWFAGWKDWCQKFSSDCVSNMTVGVIPPMLLKIHQEYLAGAKAGNDTESMCPITGNAAFCQGWLSSNNFNDEGCSDNYPTSGPFSGNLIGCPLDSMNQSGMAQPRVLIGTWNYLNESGYKMPPLMISGKMAYSPLGNFTLTIPAKNIFGDFTQEGSWGEQLDNLHHLTLCYGEGCDNNTLITVTPNYVKFTDIHNDLISLTRTSPYPSNLVGARLIDDLLSRNNQNGTVLPGVDFPGYIDLSNPFDKRPSVTAINDTYYKQKWGSREINRTSTTWTIYNATSGSNGTITFTDCNMTQQGDFIQCPYDPPIFYRELNNNLHQGTWALLYPIEKTSDHILELCTSDGGGGPSGAAGGGRCDNLVVQKSNSSHFQLLDSHGGKLYLSELVTAKGTNQTISIDQANRLLGENRLEGNTTEVDDDGAKEALSGNHHMALSFYQKALRMDPWNTYALTGVAIELYHFKNYTGAIDYSNKSLATFTADPTPTYIKGLALYKLGYYLESLKNYNQIFNINPNYPGLFDNIAAVFYHMHRYSDSLTASDAALSINVTDYLALDQKAFIFNKLGDKHQALENLNKALSINPNDRYAINLKASLINK